MNDVVIGRRIPLGAAINSIAIIFAAVYPQNAVAIMASSIPLTAILQVIYVNKYGVTTK